MKIGVSFVPTGNTYGRYGDARYEKLREHGFAAVDLNYANTKVAPYVLSEEDFSAILARERALAEKAGIMISQVHGPWCWPPPACRTPEERADSIEKTATSIRIAGELGSKYVVVHPFMPYGHDERATGLGEDTWEINLEMFRALLPLAKECGVTICLENMPFPLLSIASPDETVQFIKEINDENFKMCLDTGHATFYPEVSVPDVVRKCGEYIKVFHIHDNHGAPVDEHLFPGLGIIDWVDFGAALKEIGFDGVFSLESRLPADADDATFERKCRELATIAKRIIG